MKYKCNLKWNNLAVTQWEEAFASLGQSNILQSYDYAKAIITLEGQKPHWAVVEMDGQPAGLIQTAQVSALWGAVHGIILDRGPLWFDGFDTPDYLEAFIAEYTKQFPSRLGRKRRIVLEAVDTPKTHEIMTRYGWKRKGAGGQYQTLWLDLRPDQDDLRQSMRKSWRQSLVKAEKAPLEVRWDENGRDLPYFIKCYARDKAEKSYIGTSPQTLLKLSQACAEAQNLLIGTAYLDKNAIAAILILKHGSSATYQASWSTKESRKQCAHHRLLWEGALKLKESGIKDLDLGGFNDDTEKSLKTFKSGIGARAVKNAGLYC